MPVWVCIEWWHECEERRLVGINHLMCDYNSAAGGGGLCLSLTHSLFLQEATRHIFLWQTELVV